MQGNAPIGPGFGEVRLQRNNLVVGADGILGPGQQFERVAALEMGDCERGLQGAGGFESGQRRLQQTLVAQRNAQLVVPLRRLRLQPQVAAPTARGGLRLTEQELQVGAVLQRLVQVRLAGQRLGVTGNRSVPLAQGAQRVAAVVVA